MRCAHNRLTVDWRITAANVCLPATEALVTIIAQKRKLQLLRAPSIRNPIVAYISS